MIQKQAVKDVGLLFSWLFNHFIFHLELRNFEFLFGGNIRWINPHRVVELIGRSFIIP